MEPEMVTVRNINPEHDELYLIELTDGRQLTVHSNHISIAIGWSPNDTLEVTATRDITKMFDLLVKHQATGQEIWAFWFVNVLFPANCGDTIADEDVWEGFQQPKGGSPEVDV